MNCYKSRFFENLFTQLQSNNFYDFYIVCADGSKFGAHKIILSSSCTYFKSMFECGLGEVKNNMINLQNVERTVFQKLLNFIYSGCIDLDEESVQLVLIASDFFGLIEVVEHCCEFLSERFTPSNVIGILELSRQFGFEWLESKALVYMRLNFSEVVYAEEFKEMPFETLHLCLSQPDLCVKSEQQLFEACMSWLEYDIEARGEHFQAIRHLLRLPLLSLNFLKEFTSKCPQRLIRSHLNELINDCLQCHQISSIKSSANLISVCSINRKIVGASAYIIGGSISKQWSDPDTLSTIISFDSTQQSCANSTRSLANLHEARSGHSIAVVDRKVYIFGGEISMWMVNSVECWEVHKDRTQLVSSMPVNRSMAGACVVSNLVYLFGGQTNSVAERKVDVFNTWTNAWQTGFPLPDYVIPCHSQGVIYHEGLVYLIGGINGQGEVEQQCMAYNPVTDTFEALAPLKIPRALFGISGHKDYIYIAGGFHRPNRAVASVEKYSISRNTWESVACLKQARFHACMACVADKLYIFGGEGLSEEECRAKTLPSVECYDITLDEWSLETNGDFERSAACVAVL